MSRTPFAAVAAATALGLAATAYPTEAAVIVTTPGDSVEAARHNLDAQYSDYTSFPDAETPAMAIDGLLATKYLNFDGDDNATGIIVGLTGKGPSAVDGFRIATGNDFPERDPMTMTVEGTNRSNDANFLLNNDGDGDYTLVYSGPTGLAADPGRNTFGPTITFPAGAAYQSYRVFMTSIRTAPDPAGSGSMQFSEIELLSGTATVPEPTVLGPLGLLGLAALGRRRRRGTGGR